MLLENFMTRFIQEISGKLGKFWKESAVCSIRLLGVIAKSSAPEKATNPAIGIDINRIENAPLNVPTPVPK